MTAHSQEHPVNVIDMSINLTSDNPERLRAFYRDTLGFEVTPSGGLFVTTGISLFVDGHSEVYGPAKEPARVLLNFFVDDLKAEQTRLEVAGVPFIRKEGKEYWGGIISTFLDPDGNYCQLMEFHPPEA